METRDRMPASRPGKYEMVSTKTVPYLEKNLVRFGMTAGSATEKWYREEFHFRLFIRRIFSLAMTIIAAPGTREIIAITQTTCRELPVNVPHHQSEIE